MDTKKRIMVVEDEWVIANDISSSLKGLGYEVCATANSGEDAVMKAEQMQPDLVLMDIILFGEMDGIQAAAEIRRRWNIPVIYLTAHADDRMLQKAKITEPFGYLLKPFENNELRSTIEIALYKHQIERKLLQAKEKAEEATKLKDKFVSMIAHDLRGPLSNLAGFLKLAKDPAIQGEKKEEIIHLADDTARGLLILTEELLSVSMLKTGKVKPGPVFMDAFTAVNQVVVNSMLIAERKGISLTSQVPMNSRIYADPILFGEVLKNLVSNAIKFSKAGDSITIHIPDGKPSTIAVIDTGAGINPGLLKDLFNYETKTSTIGTSGEPGTGLGLPLSMDIMKAHQGNLSVESSLGKGSVFYAELPNVRPRILVAEDDDGERTLIEKMLEPLDVEIFKAENGREALEIINASKPHLILSDIYMPKMNGFQLLDAVRGDKSLKGISYILLTVDTSMETREKAFQHGADDFLTKPLAKEDLLPRVGKYIMKSSYWGRI